MQAQKADEEEDQFGDIPDDVERHSAGEADMEAWHLVGTFHYAAGSVRSCLQENVEEIDVEVDEAISKSWHVMGGLVTAVVQDGYIVAPNASDEDERVRLLSCPLTHLHFSTECVSPCPEAMSLFLPGKSAPQAGRFSFRWEEYLCHPIQASGPTLADIILQKIQADEVAH